MRDARRLAPPEMQEEPMRRRAIGPMLLAAVFLAVAAAYIVPRGIEARATLAAEADPARIAERALDEKFNAALAQKARPSARPGACCNGVSAAAKNGLLL